MSHESQSSIEVLDNHGSRKPSEERRISTAPSLDTIDDDGHKNETSTLEMTLTEEEKEEERKFEELDKPKVILSIGNVNLTESSSSGSVCESVCTAYEQNGRKKSSIEESKSSLSPLESIFKTSSMLLSKTVVKKEETMNHPMRPIDYNYEDLSKVDHRLKLHIFQNVLEDNDEKFMWLLKCVVIDGELSMPYVAIIVMSTKKIYILKIIGVESEDIGSWLKKSMITVIDQIDTIRAIPFECGLSFVTKTNLSFHLLLRDSKLSAVLQKHITTSSKLKIIHLIFIG